MDRENEMKKTYYSTKGYWKGYAAIQKLSKEAGVSENDAEEWLKKTSIMADLPIPTRIHP